MNSYAGVFACQAGYNASMTETYQLFKYDTCPFCLRVMRSLQELPEVEVVLRDIYTEPGAMKELMQGGGRTTTPCLRIDRDGEVQWMYESLDIMAYLQQQATAS